MAKNVKDLKEEIRRSLVISGDEEFLNLLRVIKDYIKIDKHAGPIIVSDIVRKLPQSDRIMLYMLGTRAGKYLEVLGDDAVEVGDVSGKMGIPPRVASVRLSELAGKELIVNLSGGLPGKPAKYRITDYGIQYFRHHILPKLERIKIKGRE